MAGNSEKENESSIKYFFPKDMPLIYKRVISPGRGSKARRRINKLSLFLPFAEIERSVPVNLA